MKDLKKFINESNEIDAVDYLEKIVNSTKDNKPAIWNDTESWEARDDFDYYEDTLGNWDDVLEFISDYADHKCIAGWKTKDSFEETEKIIPKKLKTIMKKSKPEIPYKKRHNQMEVWETIDKGLDVAVLKFKNYANDNGTDYVEFWYMITVG